MTVKTTGAEFKRFYNDEKYWPNNGDVYHDDEEIKVNGTVVSESFDLTKVADDALIEIDGGLVYGVAGEPSLEAYFKRWKREQSMVNILVECDVSKLDAVRAAIRAAGGKVVA